MTGNCIDGARWPFDKLRANGEGGPINPVPINPVPINPVPINPVPINPVRAEPVEAPAEPVRGLAELLAYPTERLPAAADACRRALAPLSKAAAADLLAFGVWADSVALTEAQETYARTFDFNPALCLDLGYQLFGESYKRGVFLVKIQAAVREQGIAFAPELPDSLPVVLRLLAKLGADDARALADEVVLPAVAKVLGAFVDQANPYLLVLEAVKLGLCAQYGIARIRPLPEERPLQLPGMEEMR